MLKSAKTAEAGAALPGGTSDLKVIESPRGDPQPHSGILARLRKLSAVVDVAITGFKEERIGVEVEACHKSASYGDRVRDRWFELIRNGGHA